MNKIYAVLNLLSVLLVIGVNYISQAVRLNDTTIGEVSNTYDNLFTPASYAFSIWGLIFLGLLAFAIFQIHRAYFTRSSTEFISQIGYWFCLANILNSAWVIAFVYDYMGLSVLIMLGILFSLIRIILNTNMERWDAPKELIAFVWWPICLYSGWIAVATIANISAFLTKINWNGGTFSEETWTLIMIISATAINVMVIWKRNMREFTAVGIWALFAIFMRHVGSLQTIAYTALGGAIILVSYTLYHGFQNRRSNPFYKYFKM